MTVTGRFAAGPNSLGGKFFAEIVEHAAQWGNQLGEPRIISVTLPKRIADQFMRWDRLDSIGPARYGELEQLYDAVIRVVK